MLILQHPESLCTNRPYRYHDIFTTLEFLIYKSSQIAIICIYSTSVTSVHLLELEESI